MARNKSRIFNIMQYASHPDTGETLLTEETIKKALSHKTISRYAWIAHDSDVYSEADEMNDPEHIQGVKKPLHYHIVIEMIPLTEIHTIAKWLGIPDNFVNFAKGAGAFLDCVEYLTHEDDKQQDYGKVLYPDEKVNANFDFRTELKKRAERKAKYGKDLSDKDRQRYDVLYNGKTLSQCIKDDKLLYMNDLAYLRTCRNDYLNRQKPPTTRINYYICGNGGTGKGLISRAIARSLYPDLSDDKDIFFEVGSKNATFEQYDGQPVIIWHDRRSIDLLTELNGRGNVFNVFDSHPTSQKQNVKFSCVSLCNTVNIVNSVEPYDDFLDGLAGEYIGKDGYQHKVEDKTQSYRRFPIVIQLNKQDFILRVNKGMFLNDDKYLEYMEYPPIMGNMQSISEMCCFSPQLVRKIESQTVDFIIKVHNKLLTTLDTHHLDENDVLRSFSSYGKFLGECSEFKSLEELQCEKKK